MVRSTARRREVIRRIPSEYHGGRCYEGGFCEEGGG